MEKYAKRSSVPTKDYIDIVRHSANFTPEQVAEAFDEIIRRGDLLHTLAEMKTDAIKALITAIDQSTGDYDYLGIVHTRRPALQSRAAEKYIDTRRCAVGYDPLDGYDPTDPDPV